MARNEKVRKIIFVVDDDAPVRDVLEGIIGAVYPHWEIESFESGNTALRRIDSMQPELPDIVISDIMMPDGNGYELLGKIKRLEGGADVKIIFISGNKNLQGIHRYLGKPFSIEDLIAAIEAP